MKNAEKLKNFMRFGRIYRRQDLAGVSTAVDRDLRTLVDNGEVRKLACGLYCRPKRGAAGAGLPDDRELVRVFLKTDDFLLTSYNHFTDLGLGLTQVYNHRLVYNHKRGGEFRLGGMRYQFRIVRAYPKALSKEYLLVDFLKHAGKLPEDTCCVLKNLKSHLNEFDRDKLAACLDRYGSPETKKILRGMLEKQRDEAGPLMGSGGATMARESIPLRIVAAEDDCDNLRFWLGKSSVERMAAVEFLREQYYAMSGYKSLPRLPHAIQLRSRQA
jgi:hypothetical protein